VILRRHIVVAALLVATAAASGQPVSASYGALTITVPAARAAARGAGGIALVGASTSGAPGRFGVVYAGAAAAKEPVLELRDASEKLLRTVTAGDLLGRTSAGWKVTPGGKGAPGATTTRYAFSAGGAQYTLTWSVAPVADAHLPVGRGIAMTFLLASDRASSVRARFLGAAAGRCMGDATGCFIADSASGQAVVVTGGKLASARTSGGRFQIEGPVVDLAPKSAATLLKITIAGTTAGLAAQAETQSRNILEYERTGAEEPEIVAVTRVDRTSTSPGDTVTYTIEYCNIGTAPGTGIEIRNAVPTGTRYIEDSAAGTGSLIDVIRSYERVARSIQWTFPEPILPGERRTVRFKAIVA
jgi:uncharacterized repeat protein (TIGR01451 family)